jgi:hypothetical protein
VTEIIVTCDRCRTVVAVVPTGLVELRGGTSRRRRPVDPCGECEREFDRWLAPATGQGGGAS